MRRAVVHVLAAGLLLPGACRAPPGGPAKGAPAWARVAEAHNRRLAGLEQVHADGVVEIRWTDDEGKHFEQGEAELWLRLPDRAAIEITKFGERLMWLGCDDRLAWAFQFEKKDDIVLTIADRGGRIGGDDLPVDPATIVALAGLQRLPDSGEIAPDAAGESWVLTPKLPGAPLRLHVDRRTLLPLRVELLDDRGNAILYSRIEPRRYEPLRLAGAPVAGGALFPTLFDVFSSDDRSAIKLSVRDPGPETAPEGYLDLDWLTSKFKPARLEGIAPVAARGDAPSGGS